ncbi:class I SAM-dependent methyltransferase [Paramagnetospirillum magneticum]|uniref:Class I SAM-dependent methyltransferase n=1 Tax=Paramagnetospirillum magneticum (strain ATCC 700264 / AMB-1) TaxID=342108 RepID=Q2W7D5_PARM1|nr:class I SAM-dependent methyltransferase [Paramagnetospirillum magneticum]BAE50240.1 hypothetical protein amb1436 [Paramagnetospirillum magneticum AMB-1]
MAGHDSWPPPVRRFLLSTRAGRIGLLVPRLCMAAWRSRGLHALWAALVWTFRSRDIASRSYHTTRLNQDELCWTIAAVTRIPIERIMGWRDEILADDDLARHVRRAVESSPERWSHDPDYRLGRRLAYYLLTRALRPKRVIEAGVDRGFGAVLILRALERNAAEGSPGEYLGIDRKPEADAFLYTAYPARRGRIQCGDAAAILRGLPGDGSLIIHDTGIEPTHLAAFTAALDAMLADDTVVISSWLRPDFMDLARRRSRGFLGHKDSAPGHWKPPSRMSFIFPAGRQDQRDAMRTELP